MADLKPLGSEKLEGQDKIRRIMEIARFNEALPELVNETAKSQYSVSLADGNNYEIVKERQGYIIKKTISESETDYIEPMKNRKYYNSYSQALKRLNLLAGELNRVNENEEEVSLYGEQKKFVLKTPKPEVEVPAAPAAPAPVAPPAVPSPELPPSPVPSGDEGGDVEDMSVDMDAEGDMGGEEVSMDAEMDTEMGSEPSEEQVTFKTIQKLTGKLTQKIRVLDNEEGMTSEDIKYVINMVLSSLNLGELSEEDKEDIMSKFEGESEDLGADDMDGADMTDDTEVEDIQSDMDVEIDQTQPEMGESNGAIFDSIFKESKVDKVISKYFEVSKKEILESRERKANKQQQIKESVKTKMKDVVKMTETFEQELAAKKFLEENINFQFVGITNKKNLVFENKTKQVKISPEGLVI
jgi:iron-sulfur cluster repair protein YtfE (RIC family)